MNLKNCFSIDIDDGSIRKISICTDLVIIGIDSKNNICINNTDTKKQNFRLRQEEDVFIVELLKRDSIVKINGKEITDTTRVKYNDEIMLNGASKIKIQPQILGVKSDPRYNELYNELLLYKKGECNNTEKAMLNLVEISSYFSHVESFGIAANVDIPEFDSKNNLFINSR